MEKRCIYVGYVKNSNFDYTKFNNEVWSIAHVLDNYELWLFACDEDVENYQMPQTLANAITENIIKEKTSLVSLVLLHTGTRQPTFTETHFDLFKNNQIEYYTFSTGIGPFYEKIWDKKKVTDINWQDVHEVWNRYSRKTQNEFSNTFLNKLK